MYPAFKQIGGERFSTYHAWYTRRITWFVGPLMSLQVIFHAYQVTRVDVGTTVVFAALGVMATWLITGISAVPIHARLALDGFDEPLVDRLLRVNLVRALVWTAIVLAWIPGFQV